MSRSVATREVSCAICVAPEESEPANIEGARAERALTEELTAELSARAPRSKASAAESALERLLITTAGQEGSRPTWAHVYRRLEKGAPELAKLEEELATAGWTEEAAREAARALRRRISEALKAPVARRAWRARADRRAGGRLVMTAPGAPPWIAEMTPALRRLIELGGAGAAAEVYARYRVLALGGQQWAVPQRHADRLYDWGVRGEAFASPLNSRFVGKPNAVFCSLFPDVDGVYGSLGNFFAQDLGALGLSWLVNPPFVESILRAAAEKVIAALDAPDAPPLTIFFIMAAWEDSEAYMLLDGAATKKADLRLKAGQYHYEDPSSRRVPTRAASHYFALSNSSEASEAAQLLADMLDNRQLR